MDEETVVETLNDEEATPNVDVEEAEEESLEDKLEKAEALARNYKIRAEKAEATAKKEKVEKPQADVQGLSQMDMIALVRAEVSDENMEEVLDYAKLKKISIAEALKSTVIKSILDEDKEKRTVAEATNTDVARRSSSKATDSQLLSRARSRGELPESDEDFERLADARLAKGSK